MKARTKARKRALDVLFEAEQRGVTALNMLEQRLNLPGAQTALPPYSEEIIRGVEQEIERIDELLTTYSRGWTISRMPAVDRIVLRIGMWELLYNDDVPDAVAVDEAVELVRTLSTDDSPNFVNGLLGRVLELKPTLAE